MKKMKVFCQPFTSKAFGYYVYVDKKLFEYQEHFYLLHTTSKDTHLLLKQAPNNPNCKSLNKEYMWIQEEYSSISDGENDLKKLIESFLVDQEKEAQKKILEEKRGKSVFTRLDFDKEVSL